ncbi:MAG: hypothetical protein HOE62_03330 [Alphaproteobacteria bacterium]|nr:hypothetical protein [Alphaproteobacteria bacterium]MBT4016958.1 hypothetical protein [Alphaproteobacteria bacterium]MBT4965248.1 hypothetical protein [Alphaproteobacteria bacterium]MBT5161999.1 hypothetical protein [Alphaproteobacteria bacterium]MBT5918619.1 hypothetical protein [Alphaproteobacteria bacterium]
MVASRIRILMVLLVAGVVFDLLLLESDRIKVSLGSAAELTGYWLFGVMVFLTLFNLRKKLSMIPLGSASIWLTLHAVGGVLTLALYWLHTESIWPQGVYEQVIAVLFYLTVASGIFGYVTQKIYPPRLTQSGVEVIYERIPAHIFEIREEVEALVLKCTEETRVDTLGRHYLDTMTWFFHRPRFFISHTVGSQIGRQWVRQQDANVRRYLNDEEALYLDKMTELALLKNGIDLHYALQSVMKRWLLLHLPLTAALMTLAIWHLLVVNVYAL